MDCNTSGGLGMGHDDNGSGEAVAGLGSAGAPSTRSVFRANPGDKLAALASNTPHSHTGCLRTSAKLAPFFDYLAGTVHFDITYDLAEVQRWFTPEGMDLSEWVALDRGKMGYRACVQRGDIRIFFDGSPSMGIHVVLSGQAVRQVEEEFHLSSEAAWQAWIAGLRAKGIKWARVDGAADDVGPDGVLSMETIWEHCRKRWLVTPFCKAKRLMSETLNLSDDAANEAGGGETIYLGRRDGEAFVRFYDKGAQKGEAFHHIRAECELKGRNAETIIDRFLERGFVVIVEALRSYVSFREPGRDTNRRRWSESEWWVKFLGDVEKARFSPRERVCKTLDDSKAWLYRQASSIMAVVFDALEKECVKAGADVNRAQKRLLYSLLEEGRNKYKQKHRAMLGGYVPSLVGGLQI